MPELFKIASRKHRIVHHELGGERWIRAVVRIQSVSQLGEFISLWSWIRLVHLSPDQEDTITWNLTANGQYSLALAYAVQFNGPHPKFEASKIWTAHMEPKCKFFGWFVLHGRILMADLLAVRGWPHDPRCELCLQAPETATHLCKECPFSIAVWNHVIISTNEDLAVSNFLPEPASVSNC